MKKSYDFAIVEKIWKAITEKNMPSALFAKKYSVHPDTIVKWITRYLAERSGRSYKFKRYKP